MEKVNIVLVDDHTLFRKGMEELINGFELYQVIWEADNGKDFIDKLTSLEKPDIVLMDIAMPVMDGFVTTEWLKKNHPDIKVLALSMFDKEEAILRMLKLGINGYVLKDADPSELKLALDDIHEKGSYYSDLVSNTMANQIKSGKPKKDKIQLSERELEFLRFACTDLTYKEIAERMFVSARTVDGYRDALFTKLKVKSRTALAVYAIKNGYYKA